MNFEPFSAFAKCLEENKFIICYYHGNIYPCFEIKRIDCFKTHLPTFFSCLRIIVAILSSVCSVCACVLTHTYMF